MAINRPFFFSHSKLVLFDGKMSSAQVQGLSAILTRWESKYAHLDNRFLAYMLGTVHHETGRSMQPVRETLALTDARAIAILDRAFAAGKLHSVSKPYWRADANGRAWLGRGFVQLTFETNYKRMAKLTGTDIDIHPDHAMMLSTALTILFEGMLQGSFTGKKLSDYFDGERAAWSQARRIINGMDRADLVASYAQKYYASISQTTDIAPALPSMPVPSPAKPAPPSQSPPAHDILNERR